MVKNNKKYQSHEKSERYRTVLFLFYFIFIIYDINTGTPWQYEWTLLSLFLVFLCVFITEEFWYLACRAENCKNGFLSPVREIRVIHMSHLNCMFYPAVLSR
uniref:Uncharacterized protein n=1 Tax=Cacopsylla melanoneura TaxID=428564 RepID=A0A8D8WJC3_9HEMI